MLQFYAGITNKRNLCSHIYMSICMYECKIFTVYSTRNFVGVLCNPIFETTYKPQGKQQQQI